MIKDDVVEIMIALPSNLFSNVTVPATLWFLAKDKSKNGRNRKNETLFINARNLGTMETRVIKVLTDEDINLISNTVSSWRNAEEYKDIQGFCKSIYMCIYTYMNNIDSHDNNNKRFRAIMNNHCYL